MPTKRLFQTTAPHGPFDRVMGGVSIGLVNETDGNSACVVRNNPKSINAYGLNRTFLLLTAGHLLNKFGRATKDVCHPGPADMNARGLTATNCTFGRTLDTTPAINFKAKPPFHQYTVDAGIAEYTGSMVIDRFEDKVLYCGGVTIGAMRRKGAVVKKVGRTTGLTYGQVRHEQGSFTIYESQSSTNCAGSERSDHHNVHVAGGTPAPCCSTIRIRPSA